MPPSKRVEEDLRARLARGEWKSGDRLPAVAELAAHYEVARSTVVAAERRIAEDGLIEIVPNWGVFRALDLLPQVRNSLACIRNNLVR